MTAPVNRVRMTAPARTMSTTTHVHVMRALLVLLVRLTLTSVGHRRVPRIVHVKTTRMDTVVCVLLASLGPTASLGSMSACPLRAPMVARVLTSSQAFTVSVRQATQVRQLRRALSFS